MPIILTTQAQVRAAFWRDHPQADKRKITDYSGHGKMYRTDTRCTFVDYVDSLQRNGEITPAMAQKVTL